MNKRATKRAQARFDLLKMRLEFSQTALALTGGLCDDETRQADRDDRAEISQLAVALGLQHVTIGMSHSIISLTTDDDPIAVLDNYGKR